MSLIKNGFHGTLINGLDSKRERKSGLLSAMNGCFIKNNFGQTPSNFKSFKAQPVMLRKVTGGLNFHPPTNQVQRSAPFLEASVCVLVPDASSALSGRDGLAVRREGRLCADVTGVGAVPVEPRLGEGEQGRRLSIRSGHGAHTCTFRSFSKLAGQTYWTRITLTFLNVRCVLQGVPHHSYVNLLYCDDWELSLPTT